MFADCSLNPAGVDPLTMCLGWYFFSSVAFLCRGHQSPDPWEVCCLYDLPFFRDFCPGVDAM